MTPPRGYDIEAVLGGATRQLERGLFQFLLPRKNVQFTGALSTPPAKAIQDFVFALYKSGQN